MVYAEGAEGREVQRRGERCGGSAMYRNRLSNRHPTGAPVLLEEDAATVTQNSFLCG
jgi:hypothetical protein